MDIIPGGNQRTPGGIDDPHCDGKDLAMDDVFKQELAKEEELRTCPACKGVKSRNEKFCCTECRLTHYVGLEQKHTSEDSVAVTVEGLHAELEGAQPC